MSIQPIREFHCDWSRWTFGAEVVVGNYTRPRRRREVFANVFVGPFVLSMGVGTEPAFPDHVPPAWVEMEAR